MLTTIAAAPPRPHRPLFLSVSFVFFFVAGVSFCFPRKTALSLPGHTQDGGTGFETNADTGKGGGESKL